MGANPLADGPIVQRKTINALAVTKLYSIFSKNEWQKREKHDVIFENFCNLLSNLEDHQQDLLLELSERYIWLSLNEYNGKIVHLFDNVIPKEEVDQLTKIILFPVMRPEDEEKTKSGHAIIYMSSCVRTLSHNFSHINFRVVESYDEFDRPQFKLDEDEVIYLMDDFLGTGNTIKSTVDELLMKPKITIDRLRVVSIAAHRQAISYMDEIGLKYYTDIITNRGISDYYSNPELEEKVAIMKEIEDLLPSKKYSFGYGQSESLITLVRTPNNTFPIFWHDYERDSQRFKAPFSRY